MRDWVAGWRLRRQLRKVTRDSGTPEEIRELGSQFARVLVMAAGEDTVECVCGRQIVKRRYPGQGTGSAGDENWWVHVETGRRSHTRDRYSRFFHEERFAIPKE